VEDKIRRPPELDDGIENVMVVPLHYTWNALQGGSDDIPFPAFLVGVEIVSRDLLRSLLENS
jgi:hypothetical protein